MEKTDKKKLELDTKFKKKKKKVKKSKIFFKIEKKGKKKKTKLGKFFEIKDGYSFSEVFLVTIVSLVLGFFSCFSVLTILTGGRNYFKLSRELGKFYDAYEALTENYYGEVDKDNLIDYAIDGMMSNVDDVYTSYIDKDTTSSFDELVNGIYEGIGCTIQKVDNYIKIVQVYDNSPASEAGLKADDLIVSVDDLFSEDVTVNELSDYIKNGLNSQVDIVVIRDEQQLKFTLVRDKVEIPAVTTKVFEKNNKKIGYLSISIFSSIADVQFEEKLNKLEKQKIDGLVIDVRNNSGGYLTTVSNMLEDLLSKGKILYQVQGDKERDVIKDKTNLKREYPIAVLTNINSASASEILAAGIKESYNGFIVGTKTYGKGTVQQVKKLSDGSMIKYTVENWLTPDGKWIDGVGIEPTHLVGLTEKYANDPTDENDEQLQKALELVSN